MDTASLVTVRPNPRVWWGLLFIPLATFVFLAIALGVYRAIAGSEVSRTAVLWIWGILTVAVLAWSIVRDPHLLTWSLTERDLRRGKKQHDLVIPFDDIESIVIGMPPRLPWFFRIARFHPRSSGAYRNLVTVRSTAILLRLRGRRYMPLSFLTGQFVNGQEMMDTFLKLNASKIVGPETYTDAEIRRLGRVGINRIVAA